MLLLLFWIIIAEFTEHLQHVKDFIFIVMFSPLPPPTKPWVFIIAILQTRNGRPKDLN